MEVLKHGSNTRYISGVYAILWCLLQTIQKVESLCGCQGWNKPGSTCACLAIQRDQSAAIALSNRYIDGIHPTQCFIASNIGA